MIKAVVFDFFGVFEVDIYETWLKANNLKREGAYFDVSRQSDTGAISFSEFLQQLSNLSGRKINQQELDAGAAINPEMVAIVKAAKQHYKTGLISNASSSALRKILQENNLEQYLDSIIISGEVGIAKPNPEIFKLALQQLNIAAHDAVYIDDNPEYVDAAAKLGIVAVHFTSPNELRQQLTDIGLVI